MEIAQPAQLSKLPRAGLTGDGRSRFCQVFGVQDGHRKKRQEICAAVDGNSVNIFEVVSGRNLASWPVPPDVTFLCDPFSTRIKIPDGTCCRRTWCVVQRKHNTSVECYEEFKDNKETTHTAKSYIITKSVAKVLTIQPFGEDAAVVVQDDGTVTTVLHGKDVPQSVCSMNNTAGTLKFLAVQILTADAAQTSVLKGRSDLIPNLSPSRTTIAAAYTAAENFQHKSPTVHFSVWTLNGIQGVISDSNIASIVSHEIECPAIKAASRRVRITSDSRKLEVSDKTSTMVFDLTTLNPRCTATRKFVTNDTISEIELANNIYFSLSPNKLLIHNAAFKSVLANSSRNKNDLKRRRNASSSTDVSIIAYFSLLKRIVVADNHWVYAIDIHAGEAQTGLFQNSSLLIGNMFRGTTRPSSTPPPIPQSNLSIGTIKPEELPVDWQTSRQELDALAAQKDGPGFERKLLEALSKSSFSELRRDSVPQKVAEYTLSKIFQLDFNTANVKNKPHHIKLTFLAPGLLNWLLRKGFLEDRQITRILHPSAEPFTSDMCSVAQALLEVNDSLQIMQDYINNAPYIGTVQLCSVVKSLLTTALAQSSKYMQKKLRHELKVEMDEVADPRAVAVGVGPDELTVSTVTTTCLSYALRRLASADHAIISEQFRKQFSQHEILVLIQFLRQQLFLGGYTRLVENWKSFDSNGGSEDSDTNPNPQIPLEALVLLLNGCVDALGPIGILGAEEYEDFIKDLLPDLLSEITNATQAVEDSTFLQGLVRETLRYAESVERQPFEVRLRIQKESGKLDQRGEVVTLYAEPDSEEAGIIAGAALPLGLKAVEDLNRYKTRKGGGQLHKRSVREMGMLKDRLRSNYTFERLIL